MTELVHAGVLEPRVLKRLVRAHVRGHRQKLSPWVVAGPLGFAVAERAASGREFAKAEAVLVYLADENEVPTGPIIGKAFERRLKVFLPCCRNGEWGVAPWHPGRPLRRGAFGVWEPADGPIRLGAEVQELVAYVPVVAWSTRGARIGRGAGVYDRLLANLCAKVRVRIVGLAYEFQRTCGPFSESWDVPMEKIYTEKRALELAAPGQERDERSVNTWKRIS
ncbi:MAG: 5-formyltetrahydrofolate cyclo-ligase [Candidatus Binatia bacterium]|nr:MAG: 5-formyltetrahydrofolate cyclo-ligase [Candidatus Binatia bacterium]